MSTVESGAAVRCAAWARSVDLDPGGTAGTPGGFAVVDWPLPWPRDIAEVPELAGLARQVRAHGLRLQGRVPIDGQPRSVTFYRPPAASGAFRRYEQDQVEVGAAAGDELAAAVADRLADTPGGGAVVADAPATGARWSGRTTGEVLVCTHGGRDVCCGSAGTALYLEVAGAGAAAGGTVAGRPVRRTSHTGGHRFAPTVIVLPEGTAWAFADAELIRRVVTASGPLDDLVPRYRGCTGLDSPAIQRLERAVLAELGWPLLRSARRGWELPANRVRLAVVAPGGDESQWEAEVVPGRSVRVPDCGQPLDEARKTETEWVVRGLCQRR